MAPASGVPRGSVGIVKDLADTPGAAYVPDDVVFTVHVKEIDPTGTVQIEYDLDVPLNGDPVSGPNSRGTGWTIELSEPTFPSVPGVTFGDPVFAPGDNLTVSADGMTAVAALEPGANIAVSLTNTADLGAVEIVKVIEGGAADLVPDSRVFDVVAEIDTSALGDDFPTLADREIEVTAAEPVLIEDLPIGATVSFTETTPTDDDTLTWGAPVISPESITVTAESADEPSIVTVTNTVERTVGTFSLVKAVTGEQAGNPAVPDEVTITATWDEEGTPGEKTLTLPTDGTPVPFGEDLLIGTVVTLTETPLEDGSSIAWGAPTWSGTGVVIDGESANVTITRDEEATVTVENHAATSTAGISLLKGIGGEAADEVDPGTEFPVTATWTDAEGVEQSKELTINAVEPTPLGEDLPAGTIVTITEGERPGIDTVDWGSITISGEGVEDQGDGSATVIVSEQQGDVTLVTIVNEATWAPGTFALTKEITGLSLDHPDAPESVTVTATWLDEEGVEHSKELSVPTDGTVVPFGEDLSHDTEVVLSEITPEDAESFTWTAPTWGGDGVEAGEDGTAVVTISAATVAEVSLTNTAEATLGSLTLVKSLVGDGADSVPAGTAFPVLVAWVDLLGEVQEREVEVTAGQPTTIDGLPLGTEVIIIEDEAELPSNIHWEGATWSSEDENVTILEEDVDAVAIVVTGDAGTSVTLDVENSFDKDPEDKDPEEELAKTGASGTFLMGAGLLAALLVGAGAFLVTRANRILPRP